MKLKYIMFTTHDHGFARVVPILFFEPLTHVGVFQAMSETWELAGAQLRSAGFVSFNTQGNISCYGESESLKDAKQPNHKSLGEEDAAILRHYDVRHGLL